MTSIWEEKGITPDRIRNGNIKYSLDEFAKTFKEELKQDLRELEDIDQNPKLIKRAMYDIFLLLANSPFIKQDISMASKHYNIPVDSIEVYLEKYSEESEILLTLIDIEYEALVQRHGEGNKKVIDEIDKKISKGANIIIS